MLKDVIGFYDAFEMCKSYIDSQFVENGIPYRMSLLVMKRCGNRILKVGWLLLDRRYITFCNSALIFELFSFNFTIK